MSTLEYHRPKTLREALSLLSQGVPLAGGTALVSRLSEVRAVVDLQDLGLDTLQVQAGAVVAGAMLTLQALAEARDVPAALAHAARREAGSNLRAMATLGGTLVAATGRSPLTTALLALHAQATLEPRTEMLPLGDLLERRPEALAGRLITAVRFPAAASLAFDQVARAPADRPMVCAAVARLPGRAPAFGVALGGFGQRPVQVVEAEAALAEGRPDEAVQAARAAYARAGDAWASAEYRSHLAGVLVGRLAAEVVG